MVDGHDGALLPDRLPELRGLTVDARYVPAGAGVDVGGDWYDIVAVDERRALMVIGDVSNESVAQETVSTALREFGRLDFAVNNAGVSPWTGNTVDCTLESWQRVINVNLTGTWLGMKYQIPAMLKNGRGGAIVNMTSVAALQVFEGYPVYSASKWGVVGITKVAAREFAAHGVRVNAIAPGSIETPLFSTVVNSTPTSRADYEKQTPMGRIAKAEEVAATATWLCSDAAPT